MNRIELGDLMGGAVQEKFERAFERVVENLQDQNTPYKAKRSITIKLAFSQNEARDDVQVDIDVVEKLAPQSGLRTGFSVGKDLRTGDLYAEEYGKQVRGQYTMGEVRGEKSFGEIPVDPETGEVLDQGPKVLDLRAAN